MTRGDADALQKSSEFIWNSEIWRVALNIQHRFEDGYEPSDMDGLRLDFHRMLPKPEGRVKHRHLGSLSFDTNICGLRLERAGGIAVSCGDSSEKVLARFKQLVGQTLLRVEIVPPGGDTHFVLGSELILRCFPARSHGGVSWHLSSVESEALAGTRAL